MKIQELLESKQGVAEGLNDTQKKIEDTINKLEDRLKHAKSDEQWDRISARIERLQAGLKRSKQGVAEARKANTASTRAEFGRRPRKEDPVEQDKKKAQSDEAWARLMAYADEQKKKEQGVAEGGFKNMYAEFSGYGNYMQGRAVNVFKTAGLEIVSKDYTEDDDIQTYVVKGDRQAIEKAGEFLERNAEQFGGYHFVKEELEEHIVKVKGGYELKSKHGDKNLGKYSTKAGAEKREQQVQYFKHAGK
jgi:hypothetical protein